MEEKNNLSISQDNYRGTDLEKGFYKDNEENRGLGRVGREYGRKVKEGDSSKGTNPRNMTLKDISPHMTTRDVRQVLFQQRNQEKPILVQDSSGYYHKMTVGMLRESLFKWENQDGPSGIRAIREDIHLEKPTDVDKAQYREWQDIINSTMLAEGKDTPNTKKLRQSIRDMESRFGRKQLEE